MSFLDFPHGNVYLDPTRRRPRAVRGGDPVDRPVAPGSASLASLLAPLRARINRIDDGFELVIQPMRPVDAVAPFLAASTDDREDAPGHTTNLVLGASAVPGQLPAARSLGALADEADIPILERFDDDRLVLDDGAFTRLAARSGAVIAAAARIDGPIEASDARWIARGLESGVSPLATEVRTQRAIVASDQLTLSVHARRERDVMPFVAENLRHYLAAVSGIGLERVPAPDAGLLVPLFEQSGEIAVRPIETDVYSTAVDVGIATSPLESPRPADASLIYDLHATTWHGD